MAPPEGITMHRISETAPVGWQPLAGTLADPAATDVLNVPGGVVLRFRDGLVYIPMVMAIPAGDECVTLISTFGGQVEAIMAASMKAARGAEEG